ncbi:glycogen/starch synthase, ADP-glucose type [Pirellula staleyi DSM 6068]|uniref:Glycogen synthase n=1 Tax=Pirellula staleyi (strain ATCC 27377 / DSM 6068 / ICPB 4128) TaxID=530564 RepID=D2QX34_PIRSD|nr:glycogen synthase GlgA [Pirellula staleyi]ADB17874.1 glycogen/starch synthase, ADP-glucose type [Pirellula staleyi DSM 6068]
MNILFVSSEVAPLAKTGGLADVCGALPLELARLGHQVAVIMPAYRQVKQGNFALEPLNVKFDIPIGNKIVRGRLLKTTLPGSSPENEVPVFFVEQDEYFDRPELYRAKGEDYKDNCERFVFFCRGALESIRLLKLDVDVVHCHDWQTGLIPAYLNLEYLHAAGYENIATLLTIHNLAYQGIFWHWDMLLTGLDWKYFNLHQMEFYGKLNLLKTGIVFAECLTTVSERYAQEIQTDPLGCGLEGVLAQRSEVLSGVVNGVDYSIWNPAIDPHIAKQYDVSNWQEGKAACKAALQREMGLPERSDVPLIALVGRLADQKGWDLVAQVMRRWVHDASAQWVILGTGEPHYHQMLEELSRSFRDKVAVSLQFSDPLAHRIEAGADMFLMPSRYEPCGLNQLYSLKYGAVPVVRATGGLADTVIDANHAHLSQGVATGFSFESYDVDALASALGRASMMYHHEPENWKKVVECGMKQDWSWGASAREYVSLYADAIRRKREQREQLLG